MDFQRVPIVKDLYSDLKKELKASGFTSVPNCLSELGRRWLKKEPEPMTKSDILGRNTMVTLLPQWMTNLRRNLDIIDKSYNIDELQRENGTAIVIGNGPSVMKFNHLKMLAESDYKGIIIAVDRVLAKCLKAGVVPDIMCALDGDPGVAKFLDDKIIDEYKKKIKGVFATTCHPLTVKKWDGCDRYFYNPHIDDMEKIVGASRAIQELTQKTVMYTGGNIGICGWFLSTWMKKNNTCLIGLDLSWPCPVDIETIESFKIYYNMHDGDPERVQKCFRRYFHPYFKNECITDYIMDTFYECFTAWAEGLNKQHGTMTYNATGSGLIHDAPGIKCIYFDEWLKKFKK